MVSFFFSFQLGRWSIDWIGFAGGMGGDMRGYDICGRGHAVPSQEYTVSEEAGDGQAEN
jgi:hypothetical protein